MSAIEAAQQRRAEMADAFTSGATMQEIADHYGISRQRVQVLLAREGVRREAGGQFLGLYLQYGFLSAAEFKAATRRYPGCVLRFREQKHNAKVRGIEFRFTLKVWLESWGGQWAARGRGAGLVMCRFNDVGAYEPGNVYITTASQNSSDYQQRRWHGLVVDKGDSGIASCCKIKKSDTTGRADADQR